MPRKKRPILPPTNKRFSIHDRVDLSSGDLSLINTTAKKSEYLELYSPEILEGIYKAHEINGRQLREELQRFLEYQAIQHLALAENSQSKASNAEIRGQLTDLEKSIPNNIPRAETLHPLTLQALLKAEEAFELEAIQKAEQGLGPAMWFGDEPHKV